MNKDKPIPDKEFHKEPYKESHKEPEKDEIQPKGEDGQPHTDPPPFKEPLILLDRKPRTRKKKNKNPPVKEDPPSVVFDAALLNLQSLLTILGPEFLPPAFYEWLKRYKVKKTPEITPSPAPKKVTELDIDAIDGHIIVKKGKVVVHGKSKTQDKVVKKGTPREVKLALRIGDIIIIIRGGKNSARATAYLPKKSGDPIVITMDHLDVPDELRMKIVLFHELVHVKQLLDKEGIFQGIRDGKKIQADKEKGISYKDLILAIQNSMKANAEAEGHAASILISLLEIQRHAELKAFLEGEIYADAVKYFEHYAAKAKNSIKLSNAILLVIAKLLPDVDIENRKLMGDLSDLKAFKKTLKDAIKNYQKTFPKGSEKPLADLKNSLKQLEDDIANAEAAINAFETCKKLVMKKARASLQKSTALQEQLNKLASQQRKLAEKQHQKKLETINKRNAPSKAFRDQAQDRLDDIQKEIDTANAEINRLKKAIKPLLKAAKAEIKKPITITKNKKTKKVSLQELIEDTFEKAKAAIEALKFAQDNSMTTLGLLTNDELGLLVARLLGLLQKPRTTLDKLRVKMDALGRLEKVVEKLINKLR